MTAGQSGRHLRRGMTWDSIDGLAPVRSGTLSLPSGGPFLES
jgi:hypothetical protein